MHTADFSTFIQYCAQHIKGDEKGEAQLFLDHFFKALGYEDGLRGAGANCEYRIRNDQKGGTRFADLVWKPIVLIEMKKRGVDLSLHYQQAFDYWTKLVPDRPKYVILCNFDEFWIYDLSVEIYQPLEKISLTELTNRKEAFSFMLPHPQTPIFNYNKEDVTERAAYYISHTYRSMKRRGIDSEIALKYCLQVVLSMFAEDVGLLPNQIFTRIIKELIQEQGDGPDKVTKSYDLISGLFNAMNTQGITPGGMYKDVDYFNGGLFDKIYPIELTKHELTLIDQAASKNWKNVNPAIFGSIFEYALDDKERHKLGAHYTHEIDIKKIVVPVIVQPWHEKIENAHNLDDYYTLLVELSNFRVLDPACGSGNFLFIAYKEMKLIEKQLLQLVRDLSKTKLEAKQFSKFYSNYKFVSTDQFYGIDIKPFAVELAKVTLMLAKELTWLENDKKDDSNSKPLPLDNLDKNIVCKDALINQDGTRSEWPAADAIIGNPPYQSKNKMQQEFGVEYLNKLRAAYPDIPGRADFCVYWFYRAHQHLKPDSFAGLVGTKTIRENYSRVGSLDYIVNNGGTIVDAISVQEWSGEAAIYVSIVNWKNGKYHNNKILWFYDGEGILQSHVTKIINSSLTIETDVISAKQLKANKEPKKVFQGQTHGHEGFLISKTEALQILKDDPNYSQSLKPFLIADELLSNIGSQPDRFVIDFTGKDLIEASTLKVIYKIVEKTVLPDRKKRAEEQELENKKVLDKISKANVNKHHINFYSNWWKLSYGREDMLGCITKLSRYISCAQVTKRPIFEFISSDINPNAALMVFAFDDDYSFGIISSFVHWIWFKAKCSTLEERLRYTTESVWDTFPWPQSPTEKQVLSVARAAKTLRDTRNEYMQKHKLSLRDLYRIIEKPGKNPIKDLHKQLDDAVIQAYDFIPKADLLKQLLDLNLELHTKEQKGENVQAPGIPTEFKRVDEIVSNDCVRFDPKHK